MPTKYRLKTDPRRYADNRKPTSRIPQENPAERMAILRDAPGIMKRAMDRGWVVKGFTEKSGTENI